MVGGDRPLEDFVIITILAKGDVTEYVVPSQFGRYVPLTLFLHSCAIMFRHFLRHM